MALVDTDTDSIVSSITNFTKVIKDFFSSVGDILLYIRNIIEAIRYGFTSLVSGAYNLAVEVLNGDAIVNTARAFGQISEYIGGPATVFIASMLIMIMLRIFIGFIWRIITMRDSYSIRKTNWSKGREQTWEKHVSDSIDEFENGKRLFR